MIILKFLTWRCRLKFFIAMVFVLNSFVYAVDSISFDESLAKFLVRTYSMPKWDSKKQDNLQIINNQVKELISLSTLVAGDKIANDHGEINNLNSYSKLIKSAKDILIEKIQRIYHKPITFRHIAEIDSFITKNNLAEGKISEVICNSIFQDIAIKLKEDEVKEQHKQTIKEMFGQYLSLTIKSIEENPESGVNPGFIVIDDKDGRYFVKTFSESVKSASSSSKKIDCREIFAYKVLEYLGFGPETNCLIQRFSSSQGSKSKGSYIVTKDVSIVDKPEEKTKEFFRDDDINKINDYNSAINNKEFLVELFAIATLNSILRLRDTFGDNTGNYGIVKTVMQNSSVKYEPVLIDHLPCTTNGIIDAEYSPGKFLNNSLNLNAQKASNKDSNLKKIVNQQLSSKNLNFTADVKKMVMEGKRDINLEQSIEKASGYVLQLIEINGDSFTDEEGDKGKVFSAKDMLEKHVRVVLQNYKMFSEKYN